MRLAAKVDGNQKVIVEALRSVGASVEYLFRLGKGVPDLLVGYRRRTFILELKMDDGELEESQEKWLRAWCGGPVSVVRGPLEALVAIGARVS